MAQLERYTWQQAITCVLDKFLCVDVNLVVCAVGEIKYTLKGVHSNVSFFFFKLKTAYAVRISYWSSDVCSSDLVRPLMRLSHAPLAMMPFARIGSRPLARTRGAPAKMGFPDPAVSTGFVHQLLSALPNIVSVASACA